MWGRQPPVRAPFCLPLFSYFVSWGPPAAGPVAVTLLAHLRARQDPSVCYIKMCSYTRQFWAWNIFQLFSDTMLGYLSAGYRMGWKLHTKFSGNFHSHGVSFIKTCDFEGKNSENNENSVYSTPQIKHRLVRKRQYRRFLLIWNLWILVRWTEISSIVNFPFKFLCE